MKGKGTQEEIVGIHAFGWLSVGTLHLGVPELRLDGANDTRGDPVLKVEDVLEPAVEAIGPEMSAGRGINELARNSDAVSGLAHAAFEHVADAELTPDLPNVDGFPLVGEAGVAGDNEQPAHA